MRLPPNLPTGAPLPMLEKVCPPVPKLEGPDIPSQEPCGVLTSGPKIKAELLGMRKLLPPELKSNVNAVVLNVPLPFATTSFPNCWRVMTKAASAEGGATTRRSAAAARVVQERERRGSKIVAGWWWISRPDIRVFLQSPWARSSASSRR